MQIPLLSDPDIPFLLLWCFAEHTIFNLFESFQGSTGKMAHCHAKYISKLDYVVSCISNNPIDNCR